MTPELYALALRAVACTGWKWMPGMLAVTSNGAVGFRVADSAVVPPTCLVGLPDLTDPATLGCLLFLVREVHDCPEAHTHYANGSSLWVVRWGEFGVGEWFGYGATEANALVTALENATCP